MTLNTYDFTLQPVSPAQLAAAARAVQAAAERDGWEPGAVLDALGLEQP